MAGTKESAKAPAYAAQMALFAILLCIKKLVKAGDERAKTIAQRFNKLDKVSALLPSIPVGMIATINEIVKELWGEISVSEYESSESVFSPEVIELIRNRFPQTNNWTIERGWKPLTFLFYSLQQLKDSGIEGQTAALAKISVEQLDECGLVRDGETEVVEMLCEGKTANSEYRISRRLDVAALNTLFVGTDIPVKLRAACNKRSHAEQLARTAKRLALLTKNQTEDLAATIFLEEPIVVPANHSASETIAATGMGSVPVSNPDKLGALPSYKQTITSSAIQALSDRGKNLPIPSRYGTRTTDREYEEIEPISLLQQLWHVGSVIVILFITFFVVDSYCYSGSYILGHFRAYSDVLLGLACGLLLGAAAVVFYVTSQKLYWRRDHG
jgi:hypothetical protein